MSNRLADEPSPYLRQHAENPVDWWPWCDEAFEEARRRHVPVFLSVGYATCHWCHVMAHDSFEDPEVARLLNDAFVCIKVDREERPDVDDVYMAACQAMGQRGGWPLTVVLTPERKPWFAATFIPKHSQGQRLGMLELVPRLREAWETKRPDIERESDHVLGHVSTKPPASTGPVDALWPAKAFAALRERFDPEHGGFGGAPRFPSAHTLLWLLQHPDLGDGPRALNMAKATLDGMAAGGVRDHVGGGFHRYSTDDRWFLPHFEKMLYDQAMLLRAYAAGYAATGDERYHRVAAGIVVYLERDLRHHDGGFWSAEDADSEGEEGRFYVWSLEDLRAVLGEDAEAFAAAHGVRPDGNFHDEATGQPMPTNILHLPEGLPRDDPWIHHRARLLEARARRPRPLLDDKVLTDWNGLAIGALADAATATGNAHWLRLAREAAGFVLRELRRDGVLLHRWHDGRTDERAFLDDHAFLGDGLLRLFEATQDATYLAVARDLAEALLRDFEDDHGGFRLAPRGSELDFVARVEAYDGAIPSGNAVAAGFLWRLGRLLGEGKYEEAAGRVVTRFSAMLDGHPHAFLTLLETAEAMHGGGREVVVCGDDGEADAMLTLARALRVPGQVVLRRTDATARVAPWLSAHPTPDDGALAYVCHDHACKAPVDSVEALRRELTA